MARLGIVERLYCEIHITVQPQGTTGWPATDADVFRQVLMDDKWKFSSFDHDDVDGIAGMWFLSSKEKTVDLAMQSMANKISEIKLYGYIVTRGKVEDTQFDTKYGDTLELCELDRAALSGSGIEVITI